LNLSLTAKAFCSLPIAMALIIIFINTILKPPKLPLLNYHLPGLPIYLASIPAPIIAFLGLRLGRNLIRNLIMMPKTMFFTPGTFNKPPQYPVAYTNLIVEETEVKGHDGVMIPLTIIL